MNLSRRGFLLNASISLACIPLVGITRQARAQTNELMRANLKYQNTPVDNLSCTSCFEFLPSKSDSNKGGCKLMPGDDEILANGYCTEWNSM